MCVSDSETAFRLFDNLFLLIFFFIIVSFCACLFDQIHPFVSLCAVITRSYRSFLVKQFFVCFFVYCLDCLLTKRLGRWLLSLGSSSFDFSKLLLLTIFLWLSQLGSEIVVIDGLEREYIFS